MMTRELLGAEDAAWLHMESRDNPMVVNGVVELATPVPLDDAGILFHRLIASPRFRSRLVDPRWRAGRPAWTPATDFDLAHHVEHVVLESADSGALRDFIGGAVGGLLDPKRPLWKAYWIDRPAAGTTILFRVHHAVADGFALLGVLASLCDDGSAGRDAFALRTQLPRSAAPTMLGSARALRRVVTLPADPKTILKRRLGPEKRVAWSDSVALSTVKEIARFASATVNDVLVAVAAGALGKYLRRRGEPVDGVELHAMVPVNLRPTSRAEGPAAAAPPDERSELGNRFGLVLLGLPVGIADPLRRVHEVKARMLALKSTPEAFVTWELLRALGRTPTPIEDAAVRFFAKKTSLVLTNVPGPRTQLRIAGAPISRMMFWVPQAGRMGLGISIFSYAGEVTVGVISDAGVVPDPDALVVDVRAELAALERGMRASSVA